MSRLPAPARIAPLAVALIAAALYAATLCPTVYVSGTGENITAAAILGVPHPPGFPLFCLLGRLWVAALPVSAALAVNLLAACSMAAAAGVIAWILARWTGSARAALAGGLLFAVARVPWSQAVIGEVYGLSSLLLALELALLLAWRGDLGGRPSATRRGRLFLLFAFVLGLGVSVHPLHALMTPGYLLLLWIAPGGRRARPSRSGWLAAAACGALGFSLHFYTPLRSALDPRLDWGNPEGGAAFWQYLTASQYRGRMFSLGGVEVLANLGRLGRSLVAQWTAPGLLLPALGFGLLARRRRSLALGLGLLAAADVVYAINYDIPWEIEVYYIPLILVLALAAGRAVAARRRLLAPLAALILLAAAWSNAGVAGRRGADLVDRYGRDLLDALPQRAVLITPPANPTFILLYLTAVEAARPDVDIYVEEPHGLRRLGTALDRAAGGEVRTWQLAGDPARPLYYAVREPLDELPGYTLQPVGVIYRAVPRAAAPGPAVWGTPRVDPAAVRPDDDFRLRLLAARYFLARSDHAVARGDSTAAAADRQAALRVAGDRASVHGALALRLAAEGERAAAIASYRAALRLRDDDAVLANRLGKLLVEAGEPEAAGAQFRRAIEIDPELVVARSNLGALLGSQHDFAAAAVVLREALAVDPGYVKAHNNLGFALLGQGDRRGAARAWRQSLALQPGQPRIARQLAALEGR